MPSPNTAHRRASFQVMKAELDQLKSAQRDAPDAAELLKETMRDYVDQIRGDAAEGDREIIRAELGTLADRLSEVTAAQRELLSPREREADPALLELSDQLAQLRRDMVTQQQQQRRPSSSSQRPSMVALREDVEALRSRHEAAPREALDAVRGDFQRFVEELRSDFTRTSTDERDAMRVEVAARHAASETFFFDVIGSWHRRSTRSCRTCARTSSTRRARRTPTTTSSSNSKLCERTCSPRSRRNRGRAWRGGPLYSSSRRNWRI